MEFITSNEGPRKLCYAGYAYTKKNNSKSTVRWECAQRISKECKGSLTTDIAVASAAGRVDTLKRVIRRAKRATAPPEPSSVENIPSPLPEVYITMRENGSFLIYDTESQQQRVLVFGSDDGLGLLGNSDTWFMDGTHSTVPSQFAQLLCIRVPLGDRRVIAPYALLPAKSQELYEECLTTVLDACLRK